MNIALIFAGGTGQRMNSCSKPKQFLELHGKPILIHTIEIFERHRDIDMIAVVCIGDWIEELRNLLKKNHIQKVRHIVPGGDSGQASIYNGLQALSSNCADKDIILLHDGVRPLINDALISKNIETVKKFGNAITVSSQPETVSVINQDEEIVAVYNRDAIRIAKAPQSFFFGDVLRAYQKCQSECYETIDTAQLMNHYEHELHTVACSPYNIKITTPSDFYIFRALYEAIENSQIFGL
jgi:D-ribitol-5-phosphate cytidylyltransferase